MAGEPRVTWRGSQCCCLDNRHDTAKVAMKQKQFTKWSDRYAKWSQARYLTENYCCWKVMCHFVKPIVKFKHAHALTRNRNLDFMMTQHF